MVGKYTNSYLKANTILQSEGQILFFQKMIELVNQDTPISCAYRIHNAYTILIELKESISDYYDEKINGFTVLEIVNEAKTLIDNEIVIKDDNSSFYSTMKTAILEHLKLVNNQDFDDLSKTNLELIKNYLTILFNKYSTIKYQKLAQTQLKQAIDNCDFGKIADLCQVVISSLINNKRSIIQIYKDLKHFFEFSTGNFDSNWNKWVANTIRYDAKYQCYIKYPTNITFLSNENIMIGNQIKSHLSNINGFELITDDDNYYNCSFTAPAGDVGYVMQYVYTEYLEKISILDFSSEKNVEKPIEILIYDIFNNSIFKMPYNNSPYQFRPYKQYRQAIGTEIEKCVNTMKSKCDEDYNKIIRAIACISSLQTNSLEYNYLLLWSATETLFRSSQYKTAISGIKTTVPYILTGRYVYYLIFEFVKNCKYCGVDPQYNGYTIKTDSPKDIDIENMCNLLRDRTTSTAFISKCENFYLLLAMQAKELHVMLLNSHSIRQKLDAHLKVLSYNLQRMYRVRNKYVHHSEVDPSMEALYKHLLVYLWESIREIAYVSNKNSTYSLEELYAYFRINNSLIFKKLQISGDNFDFTLLKSNI